MRKAILVSLAVLASAFVSLHHSQTVVTRAATPSGISAGGLYFACDLVDGAAMCWGNNGNGQLGDGTKTEHDVPAPVFGLSSGVTAVSAGGGHVCAIVNGGAWCWGFGGYGQLGSNATNDSDVPVQPVGLGGGVTAISAGEDHTCAVTSVGALWCWGDNGHGDVGDNTTTLRKEPVRVFASGVTAVSAGFSATCAVVGGAVECWGYNNAGQLGNNSTMDSSIPVFALASGATGVSVGYDEACAILNASGALDCWGANSDGELGDGTTTDQHTPERIIPRGVSAVSVASGVGLHVCAIVNGAAECWGDNEVGQLGNNSTTNSSVPVIAAPSPVTGITAGIDESCAIINGAGECWGNNFQGELGDGTTTERNVPTPVRFLFRDCTGSTPYRNNSGVWTAVPGAVNLLGANTNGTATSVWALGTNAVTGGCGIYQYVGGSATWAPIAGGASYLTVDSTGNPWVTQSSFGNAIYRLVGGVWNTIPGAAYEISAGAGGDVWAIGTNQVTAFGHGIYQYVGPPAYWQAINGAAEHLAVAPDHSVWAIQTTGDIYHYAAGTWTSIPGKAQQISVGYDGSVYVVGTNAVAGGYGVYKYVGAPSYWMAINGGAVQIAGGGASEFWVHQGGDVPALPNAVGAFGAVPFVAPLPPALKPAPTPSHQAVNPPSQAPQKSPASSGNTLPGQHK